MLRYVYPKTGVKTSGIIKNTCTTVPDFGIYLSVENGTRKNEQIKLPKNITTLLH